MVLCCQQNKSRNKHATPSGSSTVWRRGAGDTNMRPLRGRVCGVAARGIQTCDPFGVRCVVWRHGAGDTNMRPLRGRVCGVAARRGGYKHATPPGSGVVWRRGGIQTCDPSGVGCAYPRSKNDPVGVIISINQSHCHLPDPEGVTCLIKKF